MKRVSRLKLEQAREGDTAVAALWLPLHLLNSKDCAALPDPAFKIA